MPSYFVNDRAQRGSGDHEVHRYGCPWLARTKRKTYLGEFSNCRKAVAKARLTLYPTADGCARCCREAHTS